MVFNSLGKFSIYKETDSVTVKEMKYLKKILKHAVKYLKLKNVYFTVIVVDNDYIHGINRDYRNIDRPTDVISFALEDFEGEDFTDVRMLGDIYISIDKARSQALEYNHSVARELSFLAVHGLLHLLGYDHMNKEDEKKMFAMQDEILESKKFSSKKGKDNI